MRCITLILGVAAFLVLLPASCATVSSSVSSVEPGTFQGTLAGFLTTCPFEQHPVFLGVSPRLKDRDAEAEEALHGAALQASRYLLLRGEASFYTRKSRFGTRYINSVSIDDYFVRAESLTGQL